MSTDTESQSEAIVPEAPTAEAIEASEAAQEAEAAAEAAPTEAPAEAPAEVDDSEATGIASENAPQTVPDGGNLQWFAVQTYSGYENRVQKGIEEQVKQREMQDVFGEVIIPTEIVEEVINGKRRKMKKKVMPGYILVHMELNDETEYLVTSTPKVSGFVGVPKNRRVPPMPVPDREVARLTKQIVEGVKPAAPTVVFEVGESVRVTEGPFENFNGTIEDVSPEKQKVRVTVSIFGRSTPVELDYSQVQKITAAEAAAGN
mgnify:FL=1